MPLASQPLTYKEGRSMRNFFSTSEKRLTKVGLDQCCLGRVKGIVTGRHSRAQTYLKGTSADMEDWAAVERVAPTFLH